MMSAAVAAAAVLRVLLVDDEPLARARLRALLQDLETPRAQLVGEADNAQQALASLAALQPNVLLLDIHMPGMSGMALARQLHAQRPACALIFVTASSEHALQAFDVDAVDYLTKPVRLQRLQAALEKAAAHLGRAAAAAPAVADGPTLLIDERDHMLRVPLAEVVHARAEQKYVTLHLADGRDVIWDGTLAQLEERYPQDFVRIHRSALVQRRAVRQIKKCLQADGSESWMLQTAWSAQWLLVSRRQLAAVRDAIQAAC